MKYKSTITGSKVVSSQYEFILYACKKKKEMNKRSTKILL